MNGDDNSDGKLNRRELLRSLGAVAAGCALGSCLPHVEGEWSSCEETDGGSPPIPPPSNRVVEVRSPSVVDPDSYAIDESQARAMLAAGLLALTGAADLAGAWAAVLPARAAGERVGLKVNTLNGRVPTTPAVVSALCDSLRADGGLAAEELFVWDRTESELTRAGLTAERLGVACRGTQTTAGASSGAGYEDEPVCLSGRQIRLSRLLTQEAAHLINVAVMKNHVAAGFTACLKNHYGSFDCPGDFHEGCDEHIARLNALPQVAAPLRLCVVDTLIGVCMGDTSSPADCAPGRLLLGFDPVAVDRRAIELRDEMRALRGAGPGPAVGYLDRATELGLGAATYDLVALELT